MAGAKGEGFSSITLSMGGDAAVVTLNRPEQLNPLDLKTLTELSAAVGRIELESAAPVVVLRGAGRAFSAGGDLAGYLDLYKAPDKFDFFLRTFNRLLEDIERSSKIYVAVVHGPCVAGGIELMLACDVVLASHQAQLSDGHINFAQLPGAGGSQRLPRAVGYLKAKHLILTGATLGGEEAERIGLVTRSVPAEALESELDKLVRDLGQKSALALRGAKYLVNTGHLQVRDPGIELELNFVKHYATTSHDAYEGLNAFAEKRKPRMKGR